MREITPGSNLIIQPLRLVNHKLFSTLKSEPENPVGILRQNQVKEMNSNKFKFAAQMIAAALIFGSTQASAQNLGDIAAANMAFDNQMNTMLQGQVNQLAQSRVALRQNYVAQLGPQLQQQWQQSGMNMTFEQFVDWHMLTAGGTNYGPALQAQQNQFNAWQNANNTVQSGFTSYNNGYWANTQRVDNAMARYSNEAIMGNAGYVNPQSGEAFNLPYGAEQGVYNQGFNTFEVDQSGNYHQVDSLGYTQQLDNGW